MNEGFKQADQWVSPRPLSDCERQIVDDRKKLFMKNNNIYTRVKADSFENEYNHAQLMPFEDSDNWPGDFEFKKLSIIEFLSTIDNGFKYYTPSLRNFVNRCQWGLRNCGTYYSEGVAITTYHRLLDDKQTFILNGFEFLAMDYRKGYCFEGIEMVKAIQQLAQELDNIDPLNIHYLCRYDLNLIGHCCIIGNNCELLKCVISADNTIIEYYSHGLKWAWHRIVPELGNITFNPSTFLAGIKTSLFAHKLSRTSFKPNIYSIPLLDGPLPSTEYGFINEKYKGEIKNNVNYDEYTKLKESNIKGVVTLDHIKEIFKDSQAYCVKQFVANLKDANQPVYLRLMPDKMDPHNHISLNKINNDYGGAILETTANNLVQFELLSRNYQTYDRADFVAPNIMEYVLDSGVAIRLVLSSGDGDTIRSHMRTANAYLQQNGIIIQRAEIRSKPGEPFQALNVGTNVGTNVTSEDRQDPQTRRDSPLNNMDTITTLISHRALKEFNYNDFEHVEVIPDVGHEIKKAYIESYGRVIIKYINESDKNKHYKKLIREVMNLKDIDPNKNVIRFYGVTKEPSRNYYSIVLQQCYGENLEEYLENNFSKIDWTRKIKIAADISNGLKYIHQANIVHRALCPKNILDHDGTFMIIGFSPSVSLDYPPDPVEEISGPRDNIYVDPVCSNDDYKYDKSSDIYSLGLILWKISSGKIPHKRNKETLVNLTPIDYKELYENAWSDDSKKRPSIEEIVRGLEDIDVNHVYQDSDYIPRVYLGRNNTALKKEACLFIIKGDSQTPYLFLTQSETFIGRVESNHIVIKDQVLGKQHAKIKSFQGKVQIFDLGSVSGICVNDKKLEFRASRTLERDDVITLGKAVFQYLPAGEYENRIDKLLPIYNRTYLVKSLTDEFKNARENKQNLSLLFFDLDHFGTINKQYSWIAGDYTLKELSELIQNKFVRPKDIFARYGGEEFTILLNNTNVESAYEIAEGIRVSVETHPFTFNKEKLSVTLSIGVSEMNSSVGTSDDLLKHAEEACLKAKNDGRNRVAIWGNE